MTKTQKMVTRHTELENKKDRTAKETKEMDRLGDKIVSSSQKKAEKMKKAEEQRVKSAYREAEYNAELVKGRLNKLEAKKKK